MIEIFNSNEYRVYMDREALVFKPNSANARVLILTPPGIKPQFYSILAVLLVKFNVEVVIPRFPLPCSEDGLKNFINKLISNYRPDLTVMMGFDLGNAYGRRLVVGFDEEAYVTQLTHSRVPGSVYVVNENCRWVRPAVANADIVIKGGLTLDAVVKIRDSVLGLIQANR